MIVIRVIDGVIRKGMRIRFMAEKQDYDAEQLGIFTPKAVPSRNSASARWGSSSPT